MKKTIEKAIIIILTIFFVCFSFYDFIVQTNNLNTHRVLDHLKDVGSQTSKIYSEKFDSLQDSVGMMCELLSAREYSKYDIGHLLDANLKNRNLFSRLWYVELDGHLNNYMNNERVEPDRDFINDLLKGESGISDVFVSTYNDRKVVCVYQPVIRNNHVVGGIAGVVEINDEVANNIFSDLFNNDAYFFLTESDGNVISSVDNGSKLYDGENYLDFLDSEVNFSLYSYNDVVENIKNNQSGYVQYVYQNQNRVVYYSPSQIKDWYIFTIVSDEVVSAENSKTNKITFYLMIKILATCIFIFFFIVRYLIRINRENIQTNKKLETSNKKIEMILRQTNDRMFEYNIKEDSLKLDAWNDSPQIILNSFLSHMKNYNFVSKEHEDLLINKFKEAIDTGEKQSLDAKIPYISKDEETWFHIYIVKIEDTLIGILRNSTREMEEYNLLLQDQMFKNSVYSNALFMFAMNLKSHELLVFQHEGVYHKAMDINYDTDFLNGFLQLAHPSQREEVAHFFSYDNLLDIYHHGANNRIEFRMYNQSDRNMCIWVRFRIQFERQTSNNEIIMIAYSINIDDEKSKQLEIEVSATTDDLTGLYTRKYFNQLVDEYLAHNDNYCAYIILDLDNFKDINDTYGHHSGDNVLKEVSRLLQEATHLNGYAGRYGGDELVAFLYNQSSQEEVEDKLRELLGKIKNIHIDNIDDLSASIGVCFNNSDHDSHSLFIKADQALYVSKNSGKNRYYIYNEEDE